MNTVQSASAIVRKLIEREIKGWGDQANAERRIAARYGFRVNSITHLRTGRAKSVDAGLYSRIRAAYLDICERQVRLLQQEIAVERAINNDDDLGSLETEAWALAARIQAKKNGRE